MKRLGQQAGAFCIVRAFSSKPLGSGGAVDVSIGPTENRYQERAS